MKVTNSKPASLLEVLQITKKRADEGELGYEQQSTLEYSENFAKLAIKDGKKILEELSKNEKITAETAIKLLDICPKTPELVKTILIKDNISLDDDEISKIVKIFSK